MGKKIIDFATRRDTSRGRKSKAGGGKNQKRLNFIHPCKTISTIENIEPKGDLHPGNNSYE